jgi:protease-4
MTLATSIFGLSIALNLYLLMFSGLMKGGGGDAKTSILISGDIKQKIPVIQVSGMIDDAMMQRFDKLMKKVESDADVKALVVEIESPGGSVSASDQIYARLKKFKEEKQVPIVASMGGVAASGGYYIACAADKIIAQRTTITGSIGVLLPRYDMSKLADKWGIQDASLHSTGANFKTAGSWLRPETEEERKYWLSILDDAFGTFKDVVAKGRGTALKSSIETVADGRAFTANQALGHGLVDDLGYPQKAYEVAAKLASLSNMHVVRYEHVPSLFEAFGVQSGAPNPSATQSVNINGVNVNLSQHWIEEMMTPRLMYLWRGQ